MKTFSVRENCCLYFIWFLWVLVVALYITNVIAKTWFFVLFFSFVLILLFIFIRERLFTMFRHKKSDISNTNICVMKSDKKSDPKQKEVTIISEESFFKGNVTISGDIHVWGHIKGNVKVTEGTIHIMQGGKIEVEIEAPDMIIDGLVDGACLGNNLDILEHGELRGISRVSHM
ncbi:polymer-forming cytoskeletal protein [Arsenophonus endosymbiont of Aphis craccivora]|uniref:bactofilin family protein n=1 Tax=Arsenophonus endosymbiont of Aphis craccivora TaxID=1231049 RepID=UPI0015DCDAF9|nr:polymer-forming cytoskeletal protein [Arsenophonus endosymbiont of Aphis craccivora]QLK88322.1 polymer-forming cytoskeletal protein [Arsenophonus endosymbiont of Aphis craccivora]